MARFAQLLTPDPQAGQRPDGQPPLRLVDDRAPPRRHGDHGRLRRRVRGGRRRAHGPRADDARHRLQPRQLEAQRQGGGRRWASPPSTSPGSTASAARQQDEFALPLPPEGPRRGDRRGRFADEIVPVEGHDEKGALKRCDFDEVIRPDTTLEALSALKPVFDPKNGTITAGNASAVSDGAAGAPRDVGREGEGARQEAAGAVSARCRRSACDPSIMGYGPVPAVKKALDRVDDEDRATSSSSS